MFEQTPPRSLRLFRRDPLTLDRIAQAAILVLSPIAILLLAEASRWGFVIGLASQPFWIYATARARQVGMLAVSVIYLAIWLRGIANTFPALLS